MSLELCLRKFTESEILGPGEMGSLRKDVLVALKQQLGRKPKWDEGKSGDFDSLPLGGFETLLQLQRYAANIDIVKIPPQNPAEEDDLETDEYLETYWENIENDSALHNQLKFKHLIFTGSLGIFFIPVDFPDPLLFEDEEAEYISVGSSFQLLNELEEINSWLKLQGDYGDLGENVSVDILENDEDPWHHVRWGWLVLHWMVRLSLSKKLTICFE